MNILPISWGEWGASSYWDEFDNEHRRKRGTLKQRRRATRFDVAMIRSSQHGKRPTANRIEILRQRRKRRYIPGKGSMSTGPAAASRQREAVIKHSRGRGIAFSKSRKGHRIALGCVRRLYLRFCRRVRKRRVAREQWRTETFIGKSGRKSALKKPRVVGRARRKVSFWDVVGVTEFYAEQKPCWTMDMASDTEELQQELLSSRSKIWRGGAVEMLQKWLLAPDETAAEHVGAILGQLGDDGAAVEELLDSDGAVLWLGAVGSEWGLS